MIPLLTPKPQQIFQKQLRNARWFRNEKRRLARLASAKRRKRLNKHKKIRKCDFFQTPLGHLLIQECPQEWKTLYFLLDTDDKIAPMANLIHSILLKSHNPIVNTIKYHEAVVDFRKYGYKTPNIILFDTDEELIAIYEMYRNEEIETDLLLV